MVRGGFHNGAVSFFAVTFCFVDHNVKAKRELIPRWLRQEIVNKSKRFSREISQFAALRKQDKLF